MVRGCTNAKKEPGFVCVNPFHYRAYSKCSDKGETPTTPALTTGAVQDANNVTSVPGTENGKKIVAAASAENIVNATNWDSMAGTAAVDPAAPGPHEETPVLASTMEEGPVPGANIVVAHRNKWINFGPKRGSVVGMTTTKLWKTVVGGTASKIDENQSKRYLPLGTVPSKSLISTGVSQ